jgi:hypothetical protein
MMAAMLLDNFWLLTLPARVFTGSMWFTRRRSADE